jgi:hypothetical protein
MPPLGMVEVEIRVQPASWRCLVITVFRIISAAAKPVIIFMRNRRSYAGVPAPAHNIPELVTVLFWLHCDTIIAIFHQCARTMLPGCVSPKRNP